MVFSSLNFHILKQDSEEEEKLFLEMPLLVELRVVAPRGAQEKLPNSTTLGDHQ